MMKTLFLLTVLLFVGVSYIKADEDADTRRIQTVPRITKDEIRELYDRWKKANVLEFNLADRNETMKRFYATKQKNLEKLEKAQKEKRITKLFSKIIAGVIAVCVVVGITFCYKSMCKKKQRSDAVNPEETMETLQPNADPPQFDSHPAPQKMPYPTQEMRYTAEHQSSSAPPQHHPLQQTPYPTEQSFFSTQPMFYSPQQTFYANEKEPFLAIPLPYPQEQTLYPHQTNVHSPQSGFTYPKGPTTYPPPP